MNAIKIPELESQGFTMFQPKDLPDHPSIGITAMRRSGKTVIVQQMIAEMKDRFDEAFFFSTTADLLYEDYQFIPDENKFNHVNLDKIQEIIKSQEKMIKYNQTVPKVNRIKNRVLLLFDDCISDDRSRSKIIDGLYTRGRHIHCTVILLSQLYKNTESGGFKKTCRMNCDVLISFVQPDENHRKSFIEENLSIINKKEGMEIFNKIVEHQFCSIVINLHRIANARSYQDYVQYLKVDGDRPPRKFKIEKKGILFDKKQIKPSKTKELFKTPKIEKEKSNFSMFKNIVLKRKNSRL
jgi:hypothetical protein